METKAENLEKQRSSVKASITRIKNMVTDLMTPSELECRLGLLEAYFKQILSIQSTIENLNPDDAGRPSVEELCITTKAKIIDLMGDNYKRSGDSSFCVSTPLVSKSKLPTLHLPKFEGKYSTYKNFMGTFKQLVHSDGTLSDIERFNHLLHCLSGPALDTVRAFEITSENYNKAIKRLDERYNNKTLIFLEHISNIYNLASMKHSSAPQLRALVDNASAIYSSLKSLGSSDDISNAMLIHIVLSKVDAESSMKWKECIDFSSLPNWDNFAAVLERRCQYLESIESKSSSIQFSPSKQVEKRFISNRPQQRQLFFTQNQPKHCNFCKSSDHWSSLCAQFKALDVTSRFDTVKKLGLCINCFSSGHTVSNCSSKHQCKLCHQSHHTLLHPKSTRADTSDQSLGAVNAHIDSASNGVILATALVLIRDRNGYFQVGRALLDSCSQVNLISERFASLLNLHRENTSVEISGVGASISKIKHVTDSTIRSRFNNFELNIQFLITNRISGYLPAENLNISEWNLPKIEFADEFFHRQQPIDMLIGTEHFFNILSGGQQSLGSNLPTLQESKLGWIVTGRYSTSQQSSACRSMITTANDLNLHKQMQFLWKLEDVKQSLSKWSKDQQACEHHFVANVKTLSSGRIEVKLPFKTHPSELGSSYNSALKRFFMLEKRLDQNDELKSQYVAFMEDYERLGHMSIVSKPALEFPHYFIPHHCVLRPTSSSTKLRVVFDASAKTTTQKSLNDLLFVGPTIQDDLLIQVLRFRMFKYALTGDVVKMYRMFSVHKSDRQFQQILWRASETQPIKVYQLNTITYGMAASPFLAIRSLHFLSDTYDTEYKIGASVLKNHFYVDDMLTGSNSVEELQQIHKEVSKILANGGLELAKIQSNCKSLHFEAANPKLLNLDESQLHSALGISWDSNKDIFCFAFKPKQTFSFLTKRTILSLTASIFDPMGLICPIIIIPRVLLQNLWLQKFDWDTEVPNDVKQSFNKCLEDLGNLQKLSVPRYVLDGTQKIFLHGFSDASIRAYGCCFYVTVTNEYNISSSTLFAAKCRVAPTKKRTLPQLELCGAHLLTLLYQKIAPLFITINPRVFLWTDSSVVLRWLQLHSSTLTTFVGNRISEMQEITHNCNWKHVPTAMNPADLISRGCSLEVLRESLWFQGPSFLVQDESKWPNSLANYDSAEVQSAVRKSVFKCDLKENRIIELCNHTSSYQLTLRTVVILLRMIPVNRCKSIQTAELQRKAFLCIAWNLQQHYFADEYQCLKTDTHIRSSLKTLGLFIDSRLAYPVIRVGGRLKHSDIPEDRKHPILLPNCSFAENFIRHLHLAHFHAGAKALISFSRYTVWVVNVRNIARKIVQTCVHCIRYRPKLMQQIMGDLPLERVTPARPFQRCGVDFFGPIDTYLKIRGKTPYKSYGAIFICLVTKAVHIEAVTDLSAEAFIAALKRLIGRRGIPANIYCDNATNFVGASNKLLDLKKLFSNSCFQISISQFCLKNLINFNFIPPRAPHFGGLWEAAVKSAKGHLYRTLAGARLTFEELTTALVEIEAIMNSRPISPMSTDPNDLEALTPGHFLINSPLIALPEEPVLTDDISLLQRWRRITAAKQHFWRIWSNDYLNSLMQRNRWSKEMPNLELGSLVLVHEDHVAPLNWLLGRIVATIPGKDGRIRVADVKTRKGTLRRPIHKLALLLNS